MTRRLAILAQFDPEGGLPAHVRLHLEGLRPVVDRLILVSNSPLDPVSLATAETICDRVLVRTNTGWDFAGWRDVLATEGTADFDWVILTNSSVIGPLYPLEPIFENMEGRDADFWGMVLSRQKGLHLQSYFLSASARVVASKAWREFWASVENLEEKEDVITRYEVGFTATLMRAGYKPVPLFGLLPFPANIRLVRLERFGGWITIPISINLLGRSVRYHQELIAQGMPYLKASLIYGKDTDKFVGLDRIRAIAESNFPFNELDPPRS